MTWPPCGSNGRICCAATIATTTRWSCFGGCVVGSAAASLRLLLTQQAPWQAVQEPPRDRMRRPLGGGQRPPGRVQDELHKCVRVWSAYLDLEESLGALRCQKGARSLARS